MARKLLSANLEVIERCNERLLQGDADAAFRQLIEHDYFTLESQYFRTIFAASLAKMDFTSSFPNAAYSSLMAALPELQHLAPLRELKAMKAGGNRDIESLSTNIGTTDSSV